MLKVTDVHSDDGTVLIPDQRHSVCHPEELSSNVGIRGMPIIRHISNQDKGIFKWFPFG